MAPANQGLLLFRIPVGEPSGRFFMEMIKKGPLPYQKACLFAGPVLNLRQMVILLIKRGGLELGFAMIFK
jgi:hypothetical protein